MKFTDIKNRIRSAVKAGIDSLQAGPRAGQNSTLNYRAGNTIDPTRLARAFSSADQGVITFQAELFELVEEQDAHIFSELAKRRRAVTGLGWALTPPDDATQSELDRCEELAGMLRSIPRFEDAQYNITDAVGKGIAALEIAWKTGSEWVPSSLVWVPQRLLEIDKNKGALQYVNNGIPEPLREWGWVVHEHQAKSGYIEQAALFRVLSWTYAYKAYNVQDMQRFLETYGLPLRLGKYPAGISAEQRDELLKAVRNIGNDGAGVVPTTMEIDFIEASSGKVGDFLDAIDYWERKQSMAILGGTLTSQADGKTSTNALGVIHDKVRREIMLHDVRQIEPTWNAQLVKPIALINGMFPEDRIPQFGYLTEETADQGKMADVLIKAAALGMEIDVEYAHRVMQIPRAKDGDKILKLTNRQAIPEQAALVRMAALTATGKTDQEITGAMSARLAALCAPFEQAVFQQIAAAVGEAGDFEDALHRIEALKADPKWGEALALGMAAANLGGRSDVADSD